MNDNFESFQILTDDPIQQQNHLKDAVNYAIHEETDMFIVSKDKEFLPCQKSLLSLFSPDIAYLLSEVPSCASPTIFLPDFLARHIRSLLHILQSGQTLLSEDSNVEVIHTLANVLKIQINTISIGHYLNNPLKIEEEKVEQSHFIEELKSSIIKEEVTEDEANSEKFVQEDNQVQEVQVKKGGDIVEYVEEENDKVIKQENDKDLDIDKLLDDTMSLQNHVDTFLENSKSPRRKNFTTKENDQRVQEFIENNLRLRPMSNLVSNPYEENRYDKDEISPSAKKTKISHAPSSGSKYEKCSYEIPSLMSLNQKQLTYPQPGCWGQQRAVDASNSNVTVKCPTVAPTFVQTSTPSPTPIFPTLSPSPATVHDQVATKIMYPCAQCGTKFFDSKSLNTHLESIHGPIICEECGKQLTRRKYLKRHMNRFHKGGPLDISHKGVRYPCNLCDFNTTSRQYLKAHIEELHF